jgi:hypothetical protein
VLRVKYERPRLGSYFAVSLTIRAFRTNLAGGKLVVGKAAPPHKRAGHRGGKPPRAHAALRLVWGYACGTHRLGRSTIPTPRRIARTCARAGSRPREVSTIKCARRRFSAPGSCVVRVASSFSMVMPGRCSTRECERGRLPTRPPVRRPARRGSPAGHSSGPPCAQPRSRTLPSRKMSARWKNYGTSFGLVRR